MAKAGVQVYLLVLLRINGLIRLVPCVRKFHFRGFFLVSRLGLVLFIFHEYPSPSGPNLLQPGP